MSEVPEHLVDMGAAALHQACIDRWAQIEPGTHAGITKHPPEVHRDSARAVLEAVWAYGGIGPCLEGSHLFQASSTCSRCGTDAYNMPGADLLLDEIEEGEPDA